MLVLTRKLNETIHIGPDISLSVLGIQGNRVKLGFSAPEHVRITRPEIALRPPRFKADGAAHTDGLISPDSVST